MPLKRTIVYDFQTVQADYSVATSSDDRSIVLSIKDAVIYTYGSTSAMVQVASCESTYRQFNSDGTVLRGKVDPDDIGVFQINKVYHLKEAQSLGYDIFTTAGNIAFSKWLYQKEGTGPWDDSKSCWGQ